MCPTLLQPEERVLSTLEKDGRRRWLKPRLSSGSFLTTRRAVAWLLIAVFTLVPYLRMNDRPLILLDIVHREFTLLGTTFLPTDTLLLALLTVTILIGVFLMTALFGRVWCGWACPQTVYLEFLFRPIERLFDGTAGRGGKPARPVAGWRVFAKYLVYFLASAFLAHTFLAYFVGVENLFHWVLGSPLDHPVAFTVMAAVTGLMMFDFCYFREQLCIIACPYGRLQSVLLDRDSLIISYDEKRGEPRGAMKGGKTAEGHGDCIDCHACVTTCPTGIDIRQGLQLECVGCGQCIDACDSIMEKIAKPRGLIRYSSQNAMAGKRKRLLRARTALYPAAMAAAATLLVTLLLTRATADVTVLRNPGNPYLIHDDGRVVNIFNLKITNRSDRAATYRLDAAESPGVELSMDEGSLTVGPGETVTVPVHVLAPREGFSRGTMDLSLHVTDDQTFDRTLRPRLLGPFAGAATGS